LLPNRGRRLFLGGEFFQHFNDRFGRGPRRGGGADGGSPLLGHRGFAGRGRGGGGVGPRPRGGGGRGGGRGGAGGAVAGGVGGARWPVRVPAEGLAREPGLAQEAGLAPGPGPSMG